MAQGRLSRRANVLVAEMFREIVIPIHFKTDLTLEEQIHQRGKPLPYLRLTARLVKEFGLENIVEIGSMRSPLRHALDAFDPACCNDGHSTAYLAATGAAVYTTDTGWQAAAALEPLTGEYPNLHVFAEDGIAFLETFDKTIDVLYLDAWDVMAGTDYAEKHLEAYQTALPRLAPTCLVQIDDTDILNGGKGRLVIPQMIRDGFDLVTWGRQAILTRG